MSAKKMSTLEYIYAFVAPRVTNVGAAVVIVGAMFKIMHWPGAGMMLVVGLSTEAFLFFIGTFQPLHPDAPRPDWSVIYPQLNDPNYVPGKSPVVPGGGGAQVPAVKQDEKTLTRLAALDDALVKNITPDKIQAFGKGMKELSENVSKMSSLTDASVATKQYSDSVKQASKAILEMNKSYSTTISAMSEMANASKDAKAYHAQVKNLTKNLTELNAVYEVEMRSASKHVKSVNDFYKGLATAMENVSGAAKDAEHFKQEMSKLTTNLTSLNKVYGGMLTAMKG